MGLLELIKNELETASPINLLDVSSIRQCRIKFPDLDSNNIILAITLLN